jgi:hypothetical protein
LLAFQLARTGGQTAAPLVIAGIAAAGRDVVLVVIAFAMILIVLVRGCLTLVSGPTKRETLSQKQGASSA